MVAVEFLDGLVETVDLVVVQEFQVVLDLDNLLDPGGQSVSAGQLPSTGSFASGVDGGKVESCTTGDYYSAQGLAPCSDIGSSQFRDYLGNTLKHQTFASITRGYKISPNPGYGFRYNGGNSSSIVNGAYIGGGGAGTTVEMQPHLLVVEVVVPLDTQMELLNM